MRLTYLPNGAKTPADKPLGCCFLASGLRANSAIRQRRVSGLKACTTGFPVLNTSVFKLKKIGGGIKKPLWSVLGRSGGKLVVNSKSCPSAFPHVPQDRPKQSTIHILLRC